MFIEGGLSDLHRLPLKEQQEMKESTSTGRTATGNTKHQQAPNRSSTIPRTGKYIFNQSIINFHVISKLFFLLLSIKDLDPAAVLPPLLLVTITSKVNLQ